MKFDQSVMFDYEQHWTAQGFTKLAGMDEVGRGPLAGPVVASCVMLDWQHPIEGVRDSKKVSEKKREQLYERILSEAMAIGIGQVDERTIDRINILQATRLAMKQAVESMPIKADFILVDAIDRLDIDTPFQGIIHGDALSYLIAAASIVAKVTRDRMMIEADVVYPDYGFARNKGYGTAQHYAALREKGPCPMHRRSFLKSL